MFQTFISLHKAYIKPTYSLHIACMVSTWNLLDIPTFQPSWQKNPPQLTTMGCLPIVSILQRIQQLLGLPSNMTPRGTLQFSREFKSNLSVNNYKHRHLMPFTCLTNHRKMYAFRQKHVGFMQASCRLYVGIKHYKPTVIQSFMLFLCRHVGNMLKKIFL